MLPCACWVWFVHCASLCESCTGELHMLGNAVTVHAWLLLTLACGVLAHPLRPCRRAGSECTAQELGRLMFWLMVRGCC